MIDYATTDVANHHAVLLTAVKAASDSFLVDHVVADPHPVDDLAVQVRALIEDVPEANAEFCMTPCHHSPSPVLDNTVGRVARDESIKVAIVVGLHMCLHGVAHAGRGSSRLAEPVCGVTTEGVPSEAVASAVGTMTSQGSAHGRFQRALQRRHLVAAEMELGQLSLIDALSLVVCYARTGSPKFEKAVVRWLVRVSEERDTSLRDVRLAAECLEALRTKHHDLAEKMLFRFLS